MVHVLYGATILFFAITTADEDMRHGRIRNRTIVQGLGACLIIYIVVLVAGPFDCRSVVMADSQPAVDLCGT